MAVTDTNPKARECQLELMRRASTAEKIGAVRSLTRTVATLSRRALRRRRPDATEAEIDRAFVELHYGAELAQKLLGDA